jgi:hypothetical protein
MLYLIIIKNKDMVELENDDVIYNRLVEVDQELLVSNMLDTAMTNPNLTLIDFLRAFDYSDDE